MNSLTIGRYEAVSLFRASICLPEHSDKLELCCFQGCAFMACHCGCNFDFNTGQAYENGIGPAHLFAPEWVDDHLAMMAANLAQLGHDGVMAAAAAVAAAAHH